MLAFKEWVYIVQALISGKQQIILRKGGISEDEKDFILRDKSFLLMPTLFHQAQHLVKEDWLHYYNDNYQLPDNNTFTITHKANVIDFKVIESLDELLSLSDLHVWKEEVLLERFNRWQKNTIYCLTVTTEKLENPIILDAQNPEFGGCKSWIEVNKMH